MRADTTQFLRVKVPPRVDTANAANRKLLSVMTVGEEAEQDEGQRRVALRIKGLLRFCRIAVDQLCFGVHDAVIQTGIFNA